MIFKLVRHNIYIQIRACSILCETVSKPQESVYQTNTSCNTHILKVAIIGLPNAGKSTLINNLMDRRVIPFFLRSRLFCSHFSISFRFVQPHKKCILPGLNQMPYLLKAMHKLFLLIHQDL